MAEKRARDVVASRVLDPNEDLEDVVLDDLEDVASEDQKHINII